MRNKLSIPALFAVCAVTMLGCSSSTPQATPEQKKAFSGGPPPADYMNGVKAGAKAGEDAAKKAQQQNGGQ